MDSGTLGFAEDPASDPSRYNTSGFALPPQAPANNLINPEGGSIDPKGIGALSSPRSRDQAFGGGESPLRTLGAMMMNINRGMNGKPLYTDELRQQQKEDELLDLQHLQVTAGLLEQGMKLIQNTPDESKARIADQYGKLYAHLPGFAEMFNEAAATPGTSAAQFAALGEHAEKAVATFGPGKKALQGMALHPEIVKQWDKADDEKNGPYIIQRLQQVDQIVNGDPRSKAVFDAAAANGITPSDFLNPDLAGALGFNESMVRSIIRDPNLQREMASVLPGFVPSEDAKLKAQQDIEQVPLSRIADEARIRAEAKANATVMQFTDAHDNIQSSTYGQSARMKAMGFEPVVTGRTPTDLGANAAKRVTGKQTGERNSVIDPWVASVTGFDNTKTNQDFIDSGGSPDVSEEERTAIGNTEKAMKSARELSGNVKALVKDNPSANTRVASVERFATNMVSEYNAFVSATGGKSVDFEKEIAKYEPVFKKNGIDNALVKQAVVSLAYAQAGAWGQTGHSAANKDITLAAEAVGGSNADPDLLTRLLDQSELNFDSAYRNQVFSVTRKMPPSTLPDVAKAEAIHERTLAGEKPTQAEVTALTPRALLKWKMLRASGGTAQKKGDELAPYGRAEFKPDPNDPHSIRPDGSMKGQGWLGALKRPSGGVSSEISIGVQIAGKEIDIPTLVPALTKSEIEFLLTHGDNGEKYKVPDSIVKKAVEHAKKRIASGQSPFKD